ncbi:MAG: transglycosylase SLT domain-containing protein [Nitratireductor sp.]|jgi:soluble lytic murein transglycosylase-like protein|nr:transglycosylase SLT domain-containing protein [Nitratireductor sp.]
MSTFHRAAIAAGAMFAIAVAAPAAKAASTDNQQIKAEAVERANSLFGKLEFFDPQAARKPVALKGQLKPATKAAKAVAQAAAAKGAKGASQAAAIKGANNSLNALIAKYAAAEGVPVALAHAVIKVESNYRTNARGRAGEIGLMQIKPATARGMGFTGSAKALYDPATNLRWGMKYLGKAHQLGGGETCGTILRYNAGHGAKRMNKISAAYCGKVKKQLRRA